MGLKLLDSWPKLTPDPNIDPDLKLGSLGLAATEAHDRVVGGDTE